MQLTTLLVAALSASTLTIAAPTAAPTFNGTDPFAYNAEMEGGIEKRGTYGWLSSYRMTGKTIVLAKHFRSTQYTNLALDPFCGFGYAGARPKIQDGCVPFVPVQGRVGINWGTWPLAFDSLDVYSDGHCLKKVGTIKA